MHRGVSELKLKNLISFLLPDGVCLAGFSSGMFAFVFAQAVCWGIVQQFFIANEDGVWTEPLPLQCQEMAYAWQGAGKMLRGPGPELPFSGTCTMTCLRSAASVTRCAHAWARGLAWVLRERNGARYSILRNIRKLQFARAIFTALRCRKVFLDALSSQRHSAQSPCLPFYNWHSASQESERASQSTSTFTVSIQFS